MRHIGRHPAEDITFLAPCGLNCSVCYAHLRIKNKCPGCRSEGLKPAYCMKCSIIHCTNLAETASGFCFDCTEYPCKRLRQLNKRYTVKYKTSLIGNLEEIKKSGVVSFLNSERKKWLCPECGGTICIHTGVCVQCLK